MSYVCVRNNKQESNEVSAEDASASLNEIVCVAEVDPKRSEKPVDISTGNVNAENVNGCSRGSR